MECCEAIILGLVDGAGGREMSEDEPHGTHVASESCVVQTVEAIVVGGGDVRLRLHQQLYHVVTLLGNGVMKGRIPFQVLQGTRNNKVSPQTSQVT